uniref:Uncharacterized protein n=1 Tax=Plectus sambesii TaxID=2011161 RepID=A0A914VHP2_9BILA
MLRQNSSHRRRMPSTPPDDPYADLRPHHPTNAPTIPALCWDQKAAMFLEQIGDFRGADELLASRPPPDFAGTQRPVDTSRFAPFGAMPAYAAADRVWEESRHHDPSSNASPDELLAGLIESLCATTNTTNSEQYLLSLLKDNRLAATEQSLIRLLIEEREKQRRREEEQKPLMMAFSEKMEKQPQQTTIVD